LGARDNALLYCGSFEVECVFGAGRAAPSLVSLGCCNGSLRVCGPALEISDEVQQSNPVDPLEDCCNPGKMHIFQMTLGNLNVRTKNLQGPVLSSARDSLMWTKQLNTLSLNPRLAKSVKAGQYGKTDWSFSTDAKKWPG